MGTEAFSVRADSQKVKHLDQLAEQQDRSRNYLVNQAIVERISYYEDAGLNENQRYYFYVSAGDSSGNEGTHSDTLEIKVLGQLR